MKGYEIVNAPNNDKNLIPPQIEEQKIGKTVLNSLESSTSIDLNTQLILQEEQTKKNDYNTGENIEKEVWKEALEKLIVKPEHFPKEVIKDSIKTLETYEIKTDDFKEKLEQVIIEETIKSQRESLYTWLDFLESKNEKFNTSFKELVYNQLSKIGKPNYEKTIFEERKRPSDPYPEYNEVAVERVYNLFNNVHRFQQEARNQTFGKTNLSKYSEERLSKITVEKLRKRKEKAYAPSIAEFFMIEKTDDVYYLISSAEKAINDKDPFTNNKLRNQDDILDLLECVEKNDFNKAYAKALFDENKPQEIIKEELDRVKNTNNIIENWIKNGKWVYGEKNPKEPYKRILSYHFYNPKEHKLFKKSNVALCVNLDPAKTRTYYYSIEENYKNQEIQKYLAKIIHSKLSEIAIRDEDDNKLKEMAGIQSSKKEDEIKNNEDNNKAEENKNDIIPFYRYAKIIKNKYQPLPSDKEIETRYINNKSLILFDFQTRLEDQGIKSENIAKRLEKDILGKFEEKQKQTLLSWREYLKNDLEAPEWFKNFVWEGITSTGRYSPPTKNQKAVYYREYRRKMDNLKKFNPYDGQNAYLSDNIFKPTYYYDYFDKIKSNRYIERKDFDATPYIELDKTIIEKMYEITIKSIKFQHELFGGYTEDTESNINEEDRNYYKKLKDNKSPFKIKSIHDTLKVLKEKVDDELDQDTFDAIEIAIKNANFPVLYSIISNRYKETPNEQFSKRIKTDESGVIEDIQKGEWKETKLGAWRHSESAGDWDGENIEYEDRGVSEICNQFKGDLGAYTNYRYRDCLPVEMKEEVGLFFSKFVQKTEPNDEIRREEMPYYTFYTYHYYDRINNHPFTTANAYILLDETGKIIESNIAKLGKGEQPTIEIGKKYETANQIMENILKDKLKEFPQNQLTTPITQD